MTRVTFVLSALLVLIGAACIATGLPEVQLERGWTAVISGSVAASAGCVTFVMGALLTRLDALRATVAGLSIPAPQRVEAPVSDDLSTEPMTLEDDAVAERPVETVGRVERADVEFAFPQPAYAPKTAVPAPVSASDDEAEFTEPYPFPPDLPPNEPAVARQPTRKRPNFLAGFRSRRAAQTQDAAPPEEPTATVLPVEDFADEPPLARHEEDTADRRVEPVDRDPFGFDDPEPLRPTYAEHSPADAHSSRPFEPVTLDAEDVGPAPETAPSSTDHPLRPSVVGRYTAGSASYVMYSNGMIEVETEGGVHQFGSMQELKSFIESQEAARV